ncbi:Transcriptional regulatory protein FixJ [Erythrobacter sp. THAF29]|nr:Transcriptional regulatory protein FixJ [Erythrobacter sp. THAF29]
MNSCAIQAFPLSMTRKATLHFIDQSSRNRAELARIGFALGHHSEVYGDLSELSVHPPREGIIVARDTAEDGGIAIVLERLSRLGIWLPVIAFEADPRPGRIVEAIKAGALDYLSLPIDPDRFGRCLARIEKEAEVFGDARRRMIEARDRIESLSGREREVLEWLAEGSSNKVIARELDISPRTVEIHRANMMNKLGARHAAEAVRLKLEAKLEPRIRA